MKPFFIIVFHPPINSLFQFRGTEIVRYQTKEHNLSSNYVWDIFAKDGNANGIYYCRSSRLAMWYNGLTTYKN